MLITINDKKCNVDNNATILETARKYNIAIPTLCYHEAIGAIGSCRLCVVEIRTSPDSKDFKIVTACTYPAQEGLFVKTHTKNTKQIRQEMIQLLLARCPNSIHIQRLANEYDIETTDYQIREPSDNCILCGRCVRICEQLGFCAISTAGKGYNKTISTPMNKIPLDCTGCLSCAHVCPTEHIVFKQIDNTIRIWGKTFDLLMCKICGKGHIAKEYALALQKQRNLPSEYFEQCEQCHQKEQIRVMSSLVYNQGDKVE